MFLRSLIAFPCRKSVRSFDCSSYSIWKYSFSSKETQYEKTYQEPNIKIYELPTIKICSLISRCKVIHTAFTTIAVPSTAYANSLFELNDVHWTVATYGLIGCILFYGSSILLNNLVGAVYVNETLNCVKISYLNFWGRRRDFICDVEDIIPWSNQTPEKGLLKLSEIQRSSSSENLYLTSEYGIILNHLAFDHVFFRIKPSIQKTNISMQSNN